MKSHSFQSEHAPRGASASFSLGGVGIGGGFSLESGKCGSQDVFIGAFQDGRMRCLPYNTQGQNAVDTGMAEFIPTGDPEADKHPPVEVEFISADQISRDYGLATDTWKTAELSFSIASPVDGIPDITTAARETLKDAICPALVAELCFDNRSGESPMTGFFAIGKLPGFVQLDEQTGGQLIGVATLGHYGFATPGADGVSAFSDMFMDFPFRRPSPNRNFQTGIAGILVEVPAGESRSIPLAFGWYKPGIVTLSKSCRYTYTDYFSNLNDVLSYALDHRETWWNEARNWDTELQKSGLNESRQFLYAKSVRSYHGNAQLLSDGSAIRWIVNEGSCNMMNTLDLTVDMAFFEARMHPWLLRNVLDTFADEYSYNADVKLPDDADSYPGGISFTHDQGFRNTFAPNGQSHYEAPRHPGCFSFMTQEELLNWILCAAIYVKHSDDDKWLHKRSGLLHDLLSSMQNRDNPDPAQRNGIMGLDCVLTGDHGEITTYDSLDPSLGQARNNAYMAVKCWAGYLALAWMFEREGMTEQQNTAMDAAKLGAVTVSKAFDEKLGYIPAILEGDDRSAIIPIVEGLVYPAELQIDLQPFDAMLAILKRHLKYALCEGRCLFSDGGWKLSGNNDNSWMSKIFICQHVAERVLGFAQDTCADNAHDHWWRVGSRHQSVVDQVVGGKSGGVGSTYPRSVSAVLWLS